ncbi:secoisolariciresinol dehydrogenase [Phtheirospermum japonicum]|uniref:Secoisolariciresinol dehydrogenase n=1 Tax=Phtheirospermum japonicum TaxID=374723 RepID=A0A830CSN4_9LAMI|nr:secoisolariciresinol dehydrogenase [Phtheirospermum japonicum]
MFNNRGITVPMHLSSVLDSEKSHFEKVYAVNVFGAFLGAKHAARVMIPAKKGSIIFMSSAAAMTAIDAAPIAQLCNELGKHGIRVNCVSPFFDPHAVTGGCHGRGGGRGDGGRVGGRLGESEGAGGGDS